MSIGGMTCAACAARVEKKLSAIPGATASVNFATELATVAAPESVSAQRFIQAVEQAGYTAELARPVTPKRPADATSGETPAGADAIRVGYLRRRLIVALVFFVPLSDLSLASLCTLRSGSRAGSGC